MDKHEKQDQEEKCEEEHYKTRQERKGRCKERS